MQKGSFFCAKNKKSKIHSTKRKVQIMNFNNIVEAIGRTPLIRLNRKTLWPGGDRRVGYRPVRSPDGLVNHTFQFILPHRALRRPE